MEPIGERLSRRREELGVSLREAEAATRIRLRYLQAMEENRFDELPADVFARGFLRTYATYLGLDGSAIVDDFKTLRPPADAPVAPAPPEAAVSVRRRQRPGRAWRLPVLLAVLAAAGLVLLHMRRPPASPAARTLPAAAAPAGSPAAPHASRPASPAPAPAAKPRVVAGAAQGTLLPFSVTGASAVDVRATFSGPCWVRVWIDGVQQRPDRTLEKGQTAVWHGRRSVRILLGNPPEVHLAVDGSALAPVDSLHPLTVSFALAAS